MTKRTASAYLVLGLTILFVGSSFVTPFAGFDPDAFPNPQNNPPAQPAGYAFAIWGIIYIWLLLSALYGVWRRSEDEGWQRTRLPLSASLAVGVFWLAVASESPVAAMVMIWVMFAAALRALSRSSSRDRWMLRAPLALYTGWLAAASWVSVALIGAGYGIAFGEWAWAVLVVTAATVTAALVLKYLRDIAELGVAVTWALVAVAVKSAQSEPLIALLAGVAAMIVGALSIFSATDERA